MTSRFHPILVFVILVVASRLYSTMPASTPLITLDEAYQQALGNNEAISIARLQSEEARDRVDQARAGVLPKVSLLASYLRQDVPDGAASSSLTADQSAARFNLVQPLFRGFAEYAALRAVQASAMAKEALERQVRVDLFSLVADAFFQVLAMEKDRHNVQAAFELARKRNLEIASRVRSGRARQAESVAGESVAATLEAQQVSADAQVVKARRLMSHVSGVEVTSQLDSTLKGVTLEPLEQLRGALLKRSDVEALAQELRATEEGVGIARGAHFPSLDLGANYYLKRNGALEDSRWDASVTATFALFSGGGIEASVREAARRSQRSQITFAKLLRELNRDLDTLHGVLSSGLIEVMALSRALDLAKKNYESLSREYRFSQVSNLEVIAASSQLNETQRSLDKLKFLNQGRYYQILAIVGRVS